MAYATNNIDGLPVKIKKNKVRNRYFNYLVLVDENKQTLLQQRKGKGIWQNLYEFPLMETEKYLEQTEVAQNLGDFVTVEEPSEMYLYNENKIVHKLSHQHLHTRFWIITFDGNLKNGIQIAELHKYPVPVLIADFIKTFKI